MGNTRGGTTPSAAKDVPVKGIIASFGRARQSRPPPNGWTSLDGCGAGASSGHRHLLNSNIDWGQDLLYLKRWLDAHPDARSLRLAYDNAYGAQLVGIESGLPPVGQEDYSPGWQQRVDSIGPLPGWYAVSVNRLRTQDRQYAYFLRFRPTAMAGYSRDIYNITIQQANNVRRELGLPQLPDTG